MSGISHSGVKPKVGVNRGNAGKGRPKGSQNKSTAALKDMILAALDESGGVDYLTKQASQNPAAFLTLIGKVLPMQVSTPPGEAIVHRIELIGVAPE